MRLLGLAAGLSPAEAGTAAQAATDAGLPVLGQAGQRAGFRHALVRDAVLADLRPGEQAILAARSLDALAGNEPGFPDEAAAGSGHELAARQDFARTHPWFSVRRLAGAHTHFPMLEQPADLAADLTRFAGSLRPAPRWDLAHSACSSTRGTAIIPPSPVTPSPR